LNLKISANLPRAYFLEDATAYVAKVDLIIVDESDKFSAEQLSPAMAG